MSESAHDRAHAIIRWLWLGPAIALGLFAGRVSSELLQAGLATAIVLTLAMLVGSSAIMRRRSIWSTWPFLYLIFYVLYPEPDPMIAAAAALATVIALLQTAEPLKLPQRLTGHTANALTALVLSVGFLILYVNTLSPDMLPADAGELQLVAANWGVAHPTGFPLYTILANLLSRLPIGPNPAYRANLLSAVTSTAALLLIYLSVLRLTGTRLAGVIAAMALGLSTTFWSQATTANVRSLTALFTAAAFYLLLVLRDRQHEHTPIGLPDGAVAEHSAAARDRRPLWLMALFAFILVLAVTHHSSLVFIGAIFAIYAVLVQPAFLKEPGRWPILLLAAALALLPLLYLPLRGAAGAVGAPENLNSLGGFVNHVLGLGFRGDLFFFDRLSVLWARLAVMLNVLTFQFSPFVLLAMLTGLILLIKGDRLLGGILAISIALHTLVAAVYRAPQTVEYMLPAYVLLAVLFGYAAGFGRNYHLHIGHADLRRKLGNILAIMFVTAMILSVVAQAVQNYDSYRQLSLDMSARRYAEPLMRDAPPGAAILADWHWVTPLWYLQHVEGLRPDVEVSFVYPESGPYAGTWALRISKELAAGRDVISTHFEPTAFGDLPPAEPLHEAFLFRQEPVNRLPASHEPLAIELAPDLLAEGYQLHAGSVMPGQALVLDLAWQSNSPVDPGRTLYAHLIGPDGRLYAGDDQPAKAQPDGLSFNQFRLTPLLHTPPGLYDLVIGSYGTATNDADHAATVAQIQVRASDTPPFTSNPVYRPGSGVSEGQTLIGYDWDSTLPGRQRLYLHWKTDEGYLTQVEDVDGGRFDLPAWRGPWGLEQEGSSPSLDGDASYVPFGQGLVWLGQSPYDRQSIVPGSRTKLVQAFAAANPVLRDLVVSLRLVGYQADGRSWAWWDLDDGVPAMGAIPTLKWIRSSRVDHPVWPTISPDAEAGQEVEPLLLLYDAFTSRQLPILDERISQSAPWLPLGRTFVAPDSSR